MPSQTSSQGSEGEVGASPADAGRAAGADAPEPVSASRPVGSIPDADDIEALREQAALLCSRVDAHDKAERQRANESLIGRCFKFHNSGGGDLRWWLYIKVIDADDYWPYAFQFEAREFDSHKEYLARPRALTTGLTDDGPFGSGYIPITPEEYDEALAAFLADLNAQAATAKALGQHLGGEGL